MKALLVALGATLAVVLTAGPALGARQEQDPDEAVAEAVRWLSRQQQEDGGFDGYVPGGGTPDAILALAESAQTDPSWSVRQAVDRIDEATNDEGRTPLDAARRIARRDEAPGVTARLITRVALPLGLEVADDGPLGDLVAAAGTALEDPDLTFADRVELLVALVAAGASVPPDTAEVVAAAQQADGGWNADGDPEGDAADLATTGAAVDLLVLLGVDPAGGPVPLALAFVAESRARNGAWADPAGEASAIATAGAIRAIRAAGHDPAGSCWLTSQGRSANERSAVDGLLRLQDDDGAFAGADPVVAASDAVHALSGRRLPLGRADDACAPDEPGFPVEPSLLVLGAIAVVGVGGGLRIMRGAPGAY